MEATKDGPLLGDESDEEELDSAAAKKLDASSDPSALLKKVQVDAEMNHAGVEVEENEVPEQESDPLMLDLRDAPDLADLQQIFSENVTVESPIADIKEHQVEQPPDIIQTLHHAVHFYVHKSEKDIFDALWRLLMFLRHWKGGCDRSFLRNPRIVVNVRQNYLGTSA